MTKKNNEELLDSRRASEYLAHKWGLDSWSLPAFKMHCKRWCQTLDIHPAAASKSATFWRKSELDKFPKPDRNRPRPNRRKKSDEEPGATSALQPWDLPTAALTRAG